VVGGVRGVVKRLFGEGNGSRVDGLYTRDEHWFDESPRMTSAFVRSMTTRIPGVWVCLSGNEVIGFAPTTVRNAAIENLVDSVFLSTPHRAV
jgi:hypothetical protein